MSKDTTKNLVGQPIFKQVMKILPREQFDLLVWQCGSDRYYKSFFSWAPHVFGGLIARDNFLIKLRTSPSPINCWHQVHLQKKLRSPVTNPNHVRLMGKKTLLP